MYIGSTVIKNAYIGSQQIRQIYKGSTLLNDFIYGNPTLYTNTGGQGDRHTIITVSYGGAHWGGPKHSDLTIMVDGIKTFQENYITGVDVSGHYINFDFGVGASKIIDEARVYDEGVMQTWKWQGSNNGTNYTDIGGSFVLGFGLPFTMSSLNGNTTGYRHYRLTGVSGVEPYNSLWEMEFRIKDA